MPKMLFEQPSELWNSAWDAQVITRRQSYRLSAVDDKRPVQQANDLLREQACLVFGLKVDDLPLFNRQLVSKGYEHGSLELIY